MPIVYVRQETHLILRGKIMRKVSIEYDVYKFNELEEKVQDTVIQNLSDINVDSDWWFESEIDYFKNDKLKEIGFEDAEIHFSGFWSQGDGACFDAKINLEKVIAHLGDARFNKLLPLIKNGQISASIETASCANHYNHERTRYISFDGNISDTRHHRIYALCSLLIDYLDELRISLCREIYESLENDYNYLTSKEAIIETIESNEYEFLDTGKIF